VAAVDDDPVPVGAFGFDADRLAALHPLRRFGSVGGDRRTRASYHRLIDELSIPANAMKTHALTAVVVVCLAAGATATEPVRTPNIIFIMADDQGYGDASSYNPESKIPTPGIDRIAREGIRFTDAHSGSAVCTPTRYGLMTGRYSWRSRLQAGVMVTGDEGGCLIDASMLAVPEFLRQHGYATAIVGKWHLGYSYEFPEGEPGLARIVTEKPYGTFNILAAPVGSKIIDGPIEHGFDEFHGFHHAREMHSWGRNDTVVEHVPLDKVIARSTGESVRFIEEHARNGKPFFLYLALGSPHTPIVPSDRWVGKSGLNLYADFVMETDHATVRILETLDRLGIADNTLVFFTTDNGCSPDANIPELIANGHSTTWQTTARRRTISWTKTPRSLRNSPYCWKPPSRTAAPRPAPYKRTTPMSSSGRTGTNGPAGMTERPRRS
jgi:arylsulfatase A